MISLSNTYVQSGIQETQFEHIHRISNLDRLNALEGKIGQNVRKIAETKLEICVDLAKIKLDKLYLESDASSFKDYLRAKRVPIHYRTAHDYARIGEVYLKYRDFLADIDFKEENGLKKLLLLENALNRHLDDIDLVFTKLKSISYRDFKYFITSNSRCARAHKVDPILSVVEECIIFDLTGAELIWFDPDLEVSLESVEQVRSFKRHILKATYEFFTQNHML